MYRSSQYVAGCATASPHSTRLRRLRLVLAPTRLTRTSALAPGDIVALSGGSIPNGTVWHAKFMDAKGRACTLALDTSAPILAFAMDAASYAQVMSGACTLDTVAQSFSRTDGTPPNSDGTPVGCKTIDDAGRKSTSVTTSAGGIYYSTSLPGGAANHVDIKLTGVPDAEIHFVIVNPSGPSGASITVLTGQLDMPEGSLGEVFAMAVFGFIALCAWCVMSTSPNTLETPLTFRR